MGIGSGLNLPFYSDSVDSVMGIDPSLGLQKRARRRAAATPMKVDFLALSGEEIPAKAESFDTIVTTWTLCSIPDPEKALCEMRRVLRPDGKLLFAEHGLSRDENVARWQRRISPVWRWISRGCNLHRKTDHLIRQAGFEIMEMEEGYLPGPKITSFNYRGVARPV